MGFVKNKCYLTKINWILVKKKELFFFVKNVKHYIIKLFYYIEFEKIATFNLELNYPTWIGF